jgi:hypothetical protein
MFHLKVSEWVFSKFGRKYQQATQPGISEIDCRHYKHQNLQITGMTEWHMI